MQPQPSTLSCQCPRLCCFAGCRGSEKERTPNLNQPNDLASAHGHWTRTEVRLFLEPSELICFHLEADRGTLPQEFYTVLKRLRPAVIYAINYSADGWHAQPDPCGIVVLLLGFCPPVHPLLGSKWAVKTLKQMRNRTWLVSRQCGHLFSHCRVRLLINQ